MQAFLMSVTCGTLSDGFPVSPGPTPELVADLKPQVSQPAKAVLPMSGAEIQKYVGTYAQPNRWKIEIFTKDEKLFIRELGQELALTKIGENRFSFQFPNAARPVEIYIQPSANGRKGFIHQYVWAFCKN